MKILRGIAFGLVLATCAPLAMASTDSDLSDQMWGKFYVKLATLLRGGVKPETDPAKKTTYWCMNVPGIPLRPMAKDSPADIDYRNELLDQTAEYNPVFKKGAIPFSKVYGDIMELKVPDPAVPLTTAQQSELDAALQLTDPDNPTMVKYYDYQDKYDAAITAREAERLDNLAKGKGLTNSKTLDTQVQRVLDQWTGAGQKAKIESAFTTITKYTANDPGSWWKKLGDRYTKSIQGDFHNVSTFPPMDQWASDDGWLKFTYSNAESQSSESANSMDVQAAASVHMGGGYLEASGGYKTDASKSASSDKSLVITMEVKKVLVNRPDVDWEVFTSHKWTWPNDKGIVSNGKGKGLMPLYIDSFVIVRNVVIKGDSVAAAKQELTTEINAHVKAGYGPLSVSADFNKKDSSKSSSSKTESAAIEIKDPQIIDWGCTIVPPTPWKMAH